MKLIRSDIPLTSDVIVDDILLKTFEPFDLDPYRMTKFYPFVKPENLPEEFTIGVIVGGSGTGKSTLLKEFGTYVPPEWSDNKAIVSHFNSDTEARDKLHAAGLNSIPIWRLPYQALSTGQKFRADLARCIHDESVIDEFTSVVDRSVAVSASKSLRSYMDRCGVRKLVISTCHRDVLDWLNPDWVIDTDAGEYYVDYQATRPKWWMEYRKGSGSVGRLLLTK